MRKIPAIALLVFSSTFAFCQNPKKFNGYVNVRGKKITGEIIINLSSNAVVVQQDTINQMFFNGIESVYDSNNNLSCIMREHDDKLMLFMVVTHGTKKLLERDGEFYFQNEETIQPISSDEKQVYNLFGKDRKKVRDYVFSRNLAIDNRNDLITIFEYFSNPVVN